MRATRPALDALAAAGEALGYAIANLITLFAPPKVIIAGRAMASSEHFIRPLRETVAALLPPSLADVSDLVVREWDDSIWARGAAAMTLRELYGAPWGTTGPAPMRMACAQDSERRSMKRVSVGVIGCGNISAAYLKAAKIFPILDIVALSDMNPAAAEARGAEFGIPARPVEAVLADPAVEVILNLTVPKAHVEVGLKAIAAGKHVHSEKPLGVSVAEARRLVDAAAAKGLRLGSAPDTFLGGSHQTARQCVDDGHDRPAGRRDRLLHVSRARALASQSRLLLSRPAADRCSTWAPITSPISSTCSALSPASRASRRGRATSGW